MGGCVPPELTEQLDPHRLVMRGTQASRPHCIALQGTVGVAASCSIYTQRPSVCRELAPSWAFAAISPQCDKARIAHGMAPLTTHDWPDPADAKRVADCQTISEQAVIPACAEMTKSGLLRSFPDRRT